MHLAIDTATSGIRAVEFTPSRDGPSHGLQASHCRGVDSPILPELLGQIPEDEQIGTGEPANADGACDTRRCHSAIIDRQAAAIIPIRKDGRLWKEDSPAARARNETLRATRHHGRAFWKCWAGYHARSRIEAKVRCLRAFGERIAALAIVARTDGAKWLTPDRQNHVRVALMNRLPDLDTADIVRVA